MKCIKDVKFWKGTPYAPSQDIFEAIEANDEKAVRYYVGRGPKFLMLRNSLGQTPAHIAAMYDRVDMLRIFLNKNSRLIWVADKRGNLIIHAAGSAGSKLVVDYIIKELPLIPWLRNNYGDTLLHSAARNGRLKLVEILIDKYAMQPSLLNFSRETPAHLAAKYDHEKTLIALLERDSSIVSIKNNGNNNLLHCVAIRGLHVDAKYFENGKTKADLYLPNGRGKYPLHLAAENGHLDTVKFLLKEFNAKMLQVEIVFPSNTPVHLAALAGKLEVVDYFIDDRGVDVNLKNKRGQTPLLLATIGNHLDVVKYLVARGSNVFEEDSEKENIFFYFAHNKDLSIPKYLLDELKFKIGTNWINALNQTLLHKAIFLDNMELLKYLIEEKKVNPNMVNNKGETPIFAAASRDDLALVKYLLKFGADIHHKNEMGKTAMEVAKNRKVIEEQRKLQSRSQDDELGGTSLGVDRKEERTNQPLVAYPVVYPSLSSGNGASATPFDLQFFKYTLVIADVIFRKALSCRDIFFKAPHQPSPREIVRSKIDSFAIKDIEDDPENE